MRGLGNTPTSAAQPPSMPFWSSHPAAHSCLEVSVPTVSSARSPCTPFTGMVPCGSSLSSKVTSPGLASPAPLSFVPGPG